MLNSRLDLNGRIEVVVVDIEDVKKLAGIIVSATITWPGGGLGTNTRSWFGFRGHVALRQVF